MGNKRNKSKKRYSKFGVAGGSYGLKGKKKERQVKKRLGKTLSELKRRKEPDVMSIKKKTNLKLTFSRLSVEKAKRYIAKKNSNNINITIKAVDKGDFPGNRILNMNSLRVHVTEITTHSALCDKAREKALKGFDPIVLISEKRNGLENVISAKCTGCGKEFFMSNSDTIKTEKGELSEINVKGVWGSMVTGGGCTVMNEFMGTLGVPGMRPSQYTKTEEQIGEWWRDVLQDDMCEAGREEREYAIKIGSYHEGIPSIKVVCDGGWCKRSHKHTYNAMAGVGVIFGLHTKKLLHIGIRNKSCYICSTAEARTETPREHKCFKNWTESAQSMESNIILEGFLNCEKIHGVRYMQIIADGDSSVYSSIVENVPVWGPYVQKIECANHACKCLRSHLEQLVVDKPFYKGKGQLSLINRKRIVQGVRCAIRMRSNEDDVSAAKKKLKDDIRNCGRHVLGIHNKCSTDFCKYSQAKKIDTNNNDTITSIEIDDKEEEDDDDDGDAVKDASDMWNDTVKDMSDDEETKLRNGSASHSPINENLLKDIFIILNRMANKSDRLISNFTSNLAECWMNIRCKFDGGKVTNRCFRGSFYARCYGGGLRSSRGPAWSPMVYSKVTGKRPDDVFVDTYRKRAKHYLRTVKRQRKKETKTNRYKRKMVSSKVNTNKKARTSYGPNVLSDTQDLPEDELKIQCDDFYKDNVVVTENEAKCIEIETRGQSVNDRWKQERQKRLTSSVFGEVMSRNLNNNSPMLTKRLLYSNFGGNMYTRKGLMEEENARKEYINVQNKNENIISHITVPGLQICEEHPFLATSSDGIVHLKDGKTGLIEIKNLLQNRDFLINEAVKKEKNFCLGMSSNKISLKKSHKYFFQIQGQLNILKMAWCDLLIRRTNPYDIYVERIFRDEELWRSQMVPKLTAFYFTHLLPELAVPRNKTISGIRKPCLPWYKQSRPEGKAAKSRTPHKVSELQSLSETVKAVSQTTQATVVKTVDTSQCTSHISPQPSVSDLDYNVPTTSTGIADYSPQSTCRSSRNRKLKFVGRRISHKWENDSGEDVWYNGIVLAVSSGKDGDNDAVYQVQYVDDEEVYDVDDLNTDYRDGNLRFDDL